MKFAILEYAILANYEDTKLRSNEYRKV